MGFTFIFPYQSIGNTPKLINWWTVLRRNRCMGIAAENDRIWIKTVHENRGYGWTPCVVYVLCNLKERNLVGFSSLGMVLVLHRRSYWSKIVSPPLYSKVGQRLTVPDFDFYTKSGQDLLRTENAIRKNDGCWRSYTVLSYNQIRCARAFG